MRIDGVNKISQIYKANMLQPVNRKQTSSSKDSLEISSQVKEMQLVKKTVKESADIRLDKVEEIKRKMQAGTYEVSNKELADKMVESLFDRRV